MEECNALKHIARTAQQTPNSGNGGSSSNGNHQGSSSSGNRTQLPGRNNNAGNSRSNTSNTAGTSHGNRNNKRRAFNNTGSAPYKRQTTQANAAQIVQQTLDPEGRFKGNPKNFDKDIWLANLASANHVSVAPPNATSYNQAQFAQAMAAATAAGNIHAFHVAPDVAPVSNLDNIQNEEEVDHQNILTVTFDKTEDAEDYHYDVTQDADDEMESEDELNVAEKTDEVHDKKELTVIKPITVRDVKPVVFKVNQFNDYLCKYVTRQTNDTPEEFKIMRQRHLDGILEGMSALCPVTDAKDLTADQLGNMSYITAMLDAFSTPEEYMDWILSVICERTNLRDTLDHFITDPDPVMVARQEDGMSASDTWVTSSEEQEYITSESNDGHVGATGLTTSESDSDSHISTGTTSSVDEECQSESSIDFSEPEV